MSKGTILIVDDSPTEQHVLKVILEKAGYHVEAALDGQTGIARAKELKPNLVLMDVVMPVLNGFQATRKLREDKDTATIPVIMVTTKDQDTDKAWAERQGAQGYLVKPVAPPELLKKVSELIK
jgi:twitching motility two-component system response regulator PilH